jgi:hypothetical protein
MSLISNIALGIYGTGIVVSSIIGIREQNLKIEKYKKEGRKIYYSDYAMESFGGLMSGGFMGTIWPITVIGRVSVMFPPKEEGEKDEKDEKDKKDKE